MAESPEVVIRSQQDPDVCVRLLDRRSPDEYGTAFTVDAQADGLHAHIDEVGVPVAMEPNPTNPPLACIDRQGSGLAHQPETSA
jgi:hypothetical protein